jgi:hypothetical protein
MNPERQPSIAGVPSVQTPTSFSQGRPFFKKPETIAKTLEAFDVVSSAFQKIISSFTGPSFKILQH